ncbi:MAG: hypothetical protein C5B58_10450 [Acidobacteria bacterium]|nr:MAG: hypothetical protein C5B58_10450 [Acidobacteriota bacterium]
MKNVLSLKLAGGLAGLLLLCSLPNSALAQGSSQSSEQGASQQQQEQAKPRHHKKMHHMLAKLNLSNDQKAQIKQIHESTKSQIVAVNKDTSLTADQKKTKIREIRQNARKQTDEVLTPEQRQQLQAEMKQMREKRQQKQQTQPPPQPQG